MLTVVLLAAILALPCQVLRPVSQQLNKLKVNTILLLQLVFVAELSVILSIFDIVVTVLRFLAPQCSANVKPIVCNHICHGVKVRVVRCSLCCPGTQF